MNIFLYQFLAILFYEADVIQAQNGTEVEVSDDLLYDRNNYTGL